LIRADLGNVTGSETSTHQLAFNIDEIQITWLETVLSLLGQGMVSWMQLILGQESKLDWLMVDLHDLSPGEWEMSMRQWQTVI